MILIRSNALTLVEPRTAKRACDNKNGQREHEGQPGVLHLLPVGKTESVNVKSPIGVSELPLPLLVRKIFKRTKD